MTEEVLQEEEVSLPLSPERLLVAILKNIKEIELTVDDLLADYSNFEIAVSQERDGYVIFDLVERGNDGDA